MTDQKTFKEIEEFFAQRRAPLSFHLYPDLLRRVVATARRDAPTDSTSMSDRHIDPGDLATGAFISQAMGRLGYSINIEEGCTIWGLYSGLNFANWISGPQSVDHAMEEIFQLCNLIHYKSGPRDELDEVVP